MILQRKFTPENITRLKEDEIFVFGSNLNGYHNGGAAKYAVENFGAIEGQAYGLQGRSYAIPTLGWDMQKLPVEEIAKSVEKLYDLADYHANLTFYVTKLGCGIAGFEIEEIAAIFKAYDFTPFNIALPVEFSRIRGVKGFDKEMVCNPKGTPFQYSENTDFECDEALACNKGFHFCENPLDVLKYYSNTGGNQFAEVTGEGQISSHYLDSKVAVTKLGVGTKISFDTLLSSGLDFTLNKVKRFLFKRRDILTRRNRQDRKAVSVQDHSEVAGQNYNTVAGLRYNILTGYYYNTLAVRERGIVMGQDCNVLSGSNDNTIVGQNCNVLAGKNCNTLIGQDYNILAGKESNTFIVQDNNIVAGGSFNTMTGRDHNILVGQGCNSINMTGRDNVAVGTSGTRMKGIKGNVMCFIEFYRDSSPRIETVVINGKKYKENVYYWFNGKKVVEWEE